MVTAPAFEEFPKLVRAEVSVVHWAKRPRIKEGGDLRRDHIKKTINQKPRSVELESRRNNREGYAQTQDEGGEWSDSTWGMAERESRGKSMSQDEVAKT